KTGWGFFSVRRQESSCRACKPLPRGYIIRLQINFVDSSKEELKNETIYSADVYSFGSACYICSLWAKYNIESARWQQYRFKCFAGARSECAELESGAQQSPAAR